AEDRTKFRVFKPVRPAIDFGNLGGFPYRSALGGFDRAARRVFSEPQRHASSLARLADLVQPSPAFFHKASTRVRTSSDILITSGHGRVNPSPGHFLVASTPILEP